MTREKFKLAVALFCYGGSSCATWNRPEITNWLVDAALWMEKDPRIEYLGMVPVDKTPLSFGRNVAFKEAIRNGADFLLMLDNDMGFDSRLGVDERAKPFLPTAVNFLIEGYHRGPRVVCGPYMCLTEDAGSCIHAYRTMRRLGIDPADPHDLEQVQVSRHEAAISTGFEPMASCIMGMSLSDVRVYDLLGPTGFHHQYDDHHEVRVGTEDLLGTGEMVLAANAAGLPHPVWMNWDSWSAHYKVMKIDKPLPLELDTGLRAMRAAIDHAVEKDVYRYYVDREKGALV